jgi:hypothetical protein
LTRTLSAVARFANAHPRAVVLIFLALAVGAVGLAVLGAVSLLMYPSWPKFFFGVAIVVAAWVGFHG